MKVHPQGVSALVWDQVQVPSNGSPGTSDSSIQCSPNRPVRTQFCHACLSVHITSCGRPDWPFDSSFWERAQNIPCRLCERLRPRAPLGTIGGCSGARQGGQSSYGLPRLLVLSGLSCISQGTCKRVRLGKSTGLSEVRVKFKVTVPG